MKKHSIVSSSSDVGGESVEQPHPTKCPAKKDMSERRSATIDKTLSSETSRWLPEAAQEQVMHITCVSTEFCWRGQIGKSDESAFLSYCA